MTDHILVCPFNEKLLGKLNQRRIVIKTNDFDIIRYMQVESNKSFDLHAIKIQTEKPISAISFREEWVNAPLAIYSPEFGKYGDFLHQLNLVRKLNVRIFLSSQYESNFIGLKIFSSLNINCGLYFNEKVAGWDSMNDLMHYAIYNRTKHASIEPFNWLASNYEPTEYTDYSDVYFNNPAKFLHINEKEQIALTEMDLMNGNYIDEGLESLDRISENKKYIDFLNFRYEIMLQMNECSFCPAFRICLSKFSNLINKNDTCKPFFSDFLDAADYYHTKNIKEDQIWQL